MTKRYFFRFTLNITAEQYLNVYKGTAKNISVVAEDGRRIDFPAQRAQRFLSRDGIQGRFEMQINAEHKLIALRRID